MMKQRRPTGRTLLRETALRAVVRILLESRAIDDEAARLAGRDERRREGWEAAARAFDGISAGKQMLSWLANPRNVKSEEPLEPFVGQLLDWARGRDEGILRREETDLSRLDRNSLAKVSNLVGIGRSMDVRMPKGGATFSVEPPKPARDRDSMDQDPEEDELFTVKGDGKTWDVYFPEDPGESCAVARMASLGNDSYEIPWCTARGKNNMFYGYAARGVLLYYVVNREEPEEKYSVGYASGDFLPPRDGSATVDRENRAYYPLNAFGSAWGTMQEKIEAHANEIGESGHPVFEKIFQAAQDPKAWRDLIRRTSDDPEHVYMLFKPLILPEPHSIKGRKLRGGMLPMHPMVAINFFVTASQISRRAPYLFGDLASMVNLVIEEYGDHVPGSDVETEITKLYKVDINYPRSRDDDSQKFISVYIMNELRIKKWKEQALPAAMEDLDALNGSWEGLRDWVVKHAKIIATMHPGNGSSVPQEWSDRIASNMNDKQLMVMVRPFGVFVKLENDFLAARGWGFDKWLSTSWAAELVSRILGADDDASQCASRLNKLLELHHKSNRKGIILELNKSKNELNIKRASKYKWLDILEELEELHI